MGAQSKRARRVRTAAEFDPSRLLHRLAVPASTGIPLTSWTLTEIFAARDDQLRGMFYRPAKLADAMRTDDALSVALEGRLAPQRCIKVEIVPAKPDVRSAKIAAEAEALFGHNGIAISPDTLGSIHADLVNHDVAFAQVVATPRDDGSRVDVEVHAWPIELVRWDSTKRCFVTRVDPGSAQADGAVGGEIEIVHGDGRWIVFSRYETDPWKHGALLPASLVWARHAYALRDMAKSSVAHGCAKLTGELPAGVPLQDENGDETPEAAAFLELLRAMGTSDSPIGIRPAGAKTEFVTNTSTAWQIFTELIENGEKAAARIYLGTDGVLGSNGGAPGVDIEALFGVASTRVEGDLACISRALQTGAIEPWTAINFGDSTLAPTRRYLLPDRDADAARAADAARTTAFYDEIERAKKNGFVIDQAFVDAIAAKHGVDAPRLPPPPPAAAAPAPAALRRI